MNKRSSRKQHKSKRITQKKKRIISSRKTIHKQRGGGDMNAILLGLLDEKYVTLPTTRCLDNKDSIEIFLKSVTALDLFQLIGKDNKFVNSNTINQLLSDIDHQSAEIFRQLGYLTKAPAALKMMSNFRVNCFSLTTESNNRQSNVYMKELHSQVHIIVFKI